MKIIKIWMIIAVVILIIGMGVEITSETEVIKVTCYDKYGSKIEGADCKKEVMVEPYKSINEGLIIVFIINLFITPLVLMGIDDYLEKRRAYFPPERFR